jgi:hypothetical protein
MASDGRHDYSVYSGRRAVGVRKAWNGAEAVIDYLTTMGCRSNEIRTMGPDSVVWRGATFTARRVIPEQSAAAA